jgi:mannose-1-phosphate guanylyltransferase
MKALVLAAGKGSRLGAAAGGVPKPLVDLGGDTPLDRALRWLTEFGVEQIWINLHEGADRIRSHVDAGHGAVPISYSYEPQLLGTAGAWRQLAHEWTTTSLVVYGDNIMRFDLAAMHAAHVRSGAAATVALFDGARHANTGIAGGRARLEGARVRSFEEGGATGLINAGAYLLEPRVAATLGAGFLDFGRDVLPSLAHAGELNGYVMEAGGYCLGVDTPERLTTALRMLQAAESAS